MSSITNVLNTCGQCALTVSTDDRAIFTDCQHLFHKACLTQDTPTCLTCYPMCVICQENTGDRDVNPTLTTTCNHIFHESCFKGVKQSTPIRQQIHCPVCRTPLSEPVSIDLLCGMVMAYYDSEGAHNILERYPALLHTHIDLLRSLTMREQNPDLLTIDLVHTTCIQALRSIVLEPTREPTRELRPYFEFNRTELLFLIALLITWLVVPPLYS